MRRRRLLGLLAACAVGAVGAAPAAVARPEPAAAPAGLPVVSSGVRPGPPLLYAPPPDAPQLQNRSAAFRAETLRISGAESYVAGEYLYTDHLNDDHGADTNGSGSGAQSAAVGDLTYPSDVARYGDNAADLVELRIAVRGQDVHYRFTLNTMRARDAAVVSLAFDTDRDRATGHDVLPRDPGAPFPGTDAVLTTWGTGAEWSTLVKGAAPRTRPVAVTTDPRSAQITVVVPRTVADPRGRWAMTAAVGLWDPEANGWLLPAEQRTPTRPGGAPRMGTANGIFNVAPRFTEPVVLRGTPPDEAQAGALARNEPTAFAHPVDFDALARGVTKDLTPKTGTMIRLFPSRLSLGGGRAAEFPQFRQQLQPYSLRVPPAARTGRPLGLTLYFHALGEYHWTNNSNPWLVSVGDERDSLVVTPLNRGPDGWYQGPAEVDAFEVWNDLARHYRLDPEYVSLMGTSMGGYGAYRFASLYPDLFAKVVTNVGPPGEGIWVPSVPQSVPPETLTNNWLENVRNVPFLNLAASTDELVPLPGPRAQNLGAPEQGIRGFDQLGYRFRFRVYAPADHIVLSIYSDKAVPEFLERARVDRSPDHVSFRYVPAADDAKLGLVHDHAYWISGVRVRDSGVPTPSGLTARLAGAELPSALVDAVSEARGVGDPASTPTQDAGLGGGPPIRGAVQIAYAEVGREWGAPPAVPARNLLRLSLQGAAALAVDLQRAGIDPSREAQVEVDTDGPSEVTLSPVPAGTRVSGADVVRRDGRSVVVRTASGTVTLTPGGAPAGAAPAPAAPAAGALPATGPMAPLVVLGALLMVAAAVAHRTRVRRP